MKLIDFQWFSVTQYWGELIFILPSLSFKWERVHLQDYPENDSSGAILDVYFEFIHKSYHFIWVFKLKPENNQ
jgi:hypothetical protein